MFPATFLNFGPACSAIFLLWSFGEINQLELSIYLDIYGDNVLNTFLSEQVDVKNFREITPKRPPTREMEYIE